MTSTGLHLEQAETGLETLSKGVSAALGPVRCISAVCLMPGVMFSCYSLSLQSRPMSIYALASEQRRDICCNRHTDERLLAILVAPPKSLK